MSKALLGSSRRCDAKDMAEEDILDLADSLHILNSGAHLGSDSLTEILRQHSAASQLQHESLDCDSLLNYSLQQTSRQEEFCPVPTTPPQFLPTQFFPEEGSDGQLSCYETEPNKDLSLGQSECLSCSGLTGDLSGDACLIQNDFAASKSQLEIRLSPNWPLSPTVPPVVSDKSKEQQPSVDVDASLAAETEVCQSQDGSTEEAGMDRCKSQWLPDVFKVPEQDAGIDYRFPDKISINQPASLENYDQSGQDEVSSFEEVIVSGSILQAFNCKTLTESVALDKSSKNASCLNVCTSCDLFSDHCVFDFEKFESEHSCKGTVEQLNTGIYEPETIEGAAAEPVIETPNYGSGDILCSSPDLSLRISASKVAVNRDECTLNLVSFSEPESPEEASPLDECKNNPTPENLKDHTVSSWDQALLNFERAFGTNSYVESSSNSEGSDCELFSFTKSPVPKSKLSKQKIQCEELFNNCLCDSFRDTLLFEAEEGATALPTSEVAYSADIHFAHKLSDIEMEKETSHVEECGTGTCGLESDQELSDIGDEHISLPSVDPRPSAISSSVGEAENMQDISENTMSSDQFRSTGSQLQTTNEETCSGPRCQEQTMQPNPCFNVTSPQELLKNLYHNLGQVQFPPQVILSYLFLQLQMLVNHFCLMLNQIYAVMSQLQNAWSQLSVQTQSLPNFPSPMSNMAAHPPLSQGLETATLHSSEPDKMLEHKPDMVGAGVSSASDVLPNHEHVRGDPLFMYNAPNSPQDESSGGTLSQLSPLRQNSCDMANRFQDSQESVYLPQNETENDANTCPTDWTQVFNSIWDVCTDDEMERLFAKVKKKDRLASKEVSKSTSQQCDVGETVSLVSDPADDSFVLSSAEFEATQMKAESVDNLPTVSVPYNMNTEVSSLKRGRPLCSQGNSPTQSVNLRNGSESATKHSSTKSFHQDNSGGDDTITCAYNRLSTESCGRDQMFIEPNTDPASDSFVQTSTQVDSMENNAESVENRPRVSSPKDTNTTVSSQKRRRFLDNQGVGSTQFVKFRYGPRASRGLRSASNCASAKSFQDKIPVEDNADPASDSVVRAFSEVEAEEKNVESEENQSTVSVPHNKNTSAPSPKRERSPIDQGKSSAQTVKFRYGPRATRRSRAASDCTSTKSCHQMPLKGRDDAINGDTTLGIGTQSMPGQNSPKQDSVSIVGGSSKAEPKEGNVQAGLLREERRSSEWKSSNSWEECTFREDNVSADSRQLKNLPDKPSKQIASRSLGDTACATENKNTVFEKEIPDKAIADDSAQINLRFESSEHGIPKQRMKATNHLPNPETSKEIRAEVGPTLLASESRSWSEPYPHKTQALPKKQETRWNYNSAAENNQCRLKSERGQPTIKASSVNYRDTSAYPAWDNRQFAQRPFTKSIFSSVPNDLAAGVSWQQKPSPWKAKEPLWNCGDETKDQTDGLPQVRKTLKLEKNEFAPKAVSHEHDSGSVSNLTTAPKCSRNTLKCPRPHNGERKQFPVCSRERETEREELWLEEESDQRAYPVQRREKGRAATRSRPSEGGSIRQQLWQVERSNLDSFEQEHFIRHRTMYYHSNRKPLGYKHHTRQKPDQRFNFQSTRRANDASYFDETNGHKSQTRFAPRSSDFDRKETETSCTDIPNLTDDDKLTKPAWRPKGKFVKFVPPRMRRRQEHKDFAEY